MPAIICFVGRSKVGKTTILEAVVPEMRRRGYSVVAVKHSPHAHELDTPGKNSYRLRQAGAHVVVACTPEQMVESRLTARPVTLEDLAIRYWDYDLLLVEGFAQSPYPTVEVVRRDVNLELRAAESERIALVSDVPVQASCRRFSFEETKALADFLEATYLKRPPAEAEVSLTVDGQTVALNPFAQSLFAGILQAMVQPLKSIERPERIALGVRIGKTPSFSPARGEELRS